MGKIYFSARCFTQRKLRKAFWKLLMQTVVKQNLIEEVESRLYSQKYVIVEFIGLSASMSEG